jgi:hypothetical protein
VPKYRQVFPGNLTARHDSSRAGHETPSRARRGTYVCLLPMDVRSANSVTSSRPGGGVVPVKRRDEWEGGAEE